MNKNINPLLFGKGWAEIARHMKIDESTVRCYFDRGVRKILRNFIIINGQYCHKRTRKPVSCRDGCQKGDK